MTFAFGKSIPTSITVVDTNISIFFFKKLFKLYFFHLFANCHELNPTFLVNVFDKRLYFFTAAE